MKKTDSQFFIRNSKFFILLGPELTPRRPSSLTVHEAEIPCARSRRRAAPCRAAAHRQWKRAGDCLDRAGGVARPPGVGRLFDPDRASFVCVLLRRVVPL